MDYDKIVKGGDYDDSENDQEIERLLFEKIYINKV